MNLTQTEGQPAELRSTLGPIYAHLVDILFAVVITQGFVFLSSNNGLFSWYRAGDIASLANTFSIYVIVIGSWIRYHAVVQKLGREGEARFAIDIVLMLFYYLGFVLVSNSFAISVLFLLIFFLYAVWAMLREKEKPNEKINRWTAGVKINLRFTVLAGLVLAINFIPPYIGNWDSKILVSLFLGILAIWYNAIWFRNARRRSKLIG